MKKNSIKLFNQTIILHNLLSFILDRRERECPTSLLSLLSTLEKKIMKGEEKRVNMNERRKNNEHNDD